MVQGHCSRTSLLEFSTLPWTSLSCVSVETKVHVINGGTLTISLSSDEVNEYSEGAGLSVRAVCELVSEPSMAMRLVLLYNDHKSPR